MFAMKYRVFLVFALFTLGLGQALAGPEEELRRYVDENTQKLVQKLNAERGLYDKDPEAFYSSMDETLDQFVDFRRIAARVMGRYARQTTSEQRDEFVEKFKRSLFDSYAQALVSADSFQITVKEAAIMRENDARGTVQMELVNSSGTRYPLTYSMYRNADGRWLMENVIVEGINIGLAFRDRFAQEMEENRGQVQAVIDGWGDTIESLNLEEELDRS
ncbi:phospholipid-binding protein MlaC [Marinobacter sp.]|uniref:MlaC/ttg2D family ABC transporter substrate-binding protein n=1 Tax=Marinobacter sp. TaxID=50741 RepID=UPI0019DB1B5A|nr:ABC transporter substrate-binding protein [Marinobacter sp.]MBE0486280.1 ABC transporter substrate-binding protein [Marinobacter sp.]